MNIPIRWSDNTAELKQHLLSGLQAIEVTQASVDKLATSLGGSRMIGAAQRLAEAIGQIGGAQKLTNAELDRANALFTKAAEKLTLLGNVEAAKKMEQFALATQRTVSVGEQFSNVFGKVSGLLGTLGIGLSAFAAINFGKEILADADSLVKLSDKTDISLQGLQKFRVAGDDAGNTLEEITNAVNMMQKRIATGDDSALASIQQMGISLEQFKALKPEDQFIAISDAVRQIHDPLKQAEFLAGLLGKSWAEVLPTLKRGFDDVKDSAVGMSDESIKALDRLGDKIQATWRRLKGIAGEFVGESVRTGEQLNITFAEWEKLGLPPMGAIPKTPALPIGGGPPIGLSPDQLKAAEKDLVDLNRDAIEANRKRIAAEEEQWKQHLAFLEGLRSDFTGPIAPDLKDQIQQYLDFGASVEQISKELHINRGEVEAIADAYKRQKMEVAAVNAVQAIYLSQLERQLIREADWLNIGQRITQLQASGGLAGSNIPFGQIIEQLPRTTKIDEAGVKVALQPLAKGVYDVFSESFKKLPDLMIAAFTGGGNLKGAFQGLATTITEGLFGEKGPWETATKKLAGWVTKAFSGLGESFSKILGSTIGGLLPGIGGLVGPLISWISGIGGPNDAQKGARAQLQELIDKAKQLATQSQITRGALTDNFSVLRVVIGDALQQIGKNGQQTDLILRDLLDTEHPQRFAAALREVQHALDIQAKSQQALTDALGRYHFTEEQLGPALERQHLNEQFKQLYQDFQILTGAGVDMAAVTQQMSANMSAYVQLAKKTGAEIPEAMKPILQNFIDQGQLFDENGNKITDLNDAGLTFAATMGDVVKAVKELTDTLRRGLGLAVDDVTDKINKIPRNVDVNVNVNTTGSGFPGDQQVQLEPDPYITGGATGGLVTSAGIMPDYLSEAPTIWPSRGGDTVPAMLSPGERVLTAPQNRSLEAAISSMSAGSGQPIVVQVMMDGQIVAETTVKKIAEDKRGVRTRAQRALGMANA